MNCSILVVDDSPAMRNVIRRAIAISGFPAGSIMNAADGMEALEVLANNSVDLVLTDINMPKLTGEQLLEQMEADPRLRTIPVIVISTDSTDARMQRMLERGARGYVTKPFHPETLRSALERVLPGPVEV